ncbi:MAG: hypothetical protein Q9159_000596 [Coniocarpon cinnabarinum]
MAESTNRYAQYKYGAMSNLVLQADRRFLNRADDQSGDPESLAGRISIRDMGSRIGREEQSAPKKIKTPGIQRADIQEGADVLERQSKKRKRGEPQAQSSLSIAELEVEDLRYRPRTQATRDTYNLLFTAIGRKLGGVSNTVTVSAVDAVLETLKSDEMKDFDKKRDVEDIIGTQLSSKEFNEAMNLSKKITDYDNQDDDAGQADGANGVAQDELDDRQGVAVDFDEDEDEDEEGVKRSYEVRDEGESSDEEPSDFAQRHGAPDAAVAGGADADAIEQAADGGDGLIFNAGDDVDSTKTQKETRAVPAHEIDAYWLQRQVGQVFHDPHLQQEKTKDAMEILGRQSDNGELAPLREVENDVMELFDYEHHELVSKIVYNRDCIVWVTRWRQTSEDENARKTVETAMYRAGQQQLLRELVSRGYADSARGADGGKQEKADLMNLDVSSGAKDVAMADADAGLKGNMQPRNTINLENLVFDQGNHLMTNPNVKLPPGSTQKKFKGYDEIHVPAPKPQRAPTEKKNMPTSELPAWARPGFGSSKELNRIQTKCFPASFESDENMLICAPTGSGKTNIAMLTMLREIGKHRNPETGEVSLDDFKIIYIAPLKALVAEQTGNFGKRLAPYGIRVAELTGDRQLTKQQIAETQVIVTTPEKWDVITRKATDLSYTNLVRLICIDEIHLLHDDRGPVLESIVSRTIRKTEQTGEPVRIIGLSATLPNYRDVASFLRVDPEHGMYHFDGSFRPCPLQQEFVGVTDKKPIKQLRTMNDVCYKKVLEQVGQKRNQMLIFVHSRKDTAKTAKYIKDRALEEETIGQILRTDAASREILTQEAEQSGNGDLKEILPFGFGIHHAGMSRADRTSVEELFADGSIQVLVCTATLAWGVNLPAHTVIIKGTTVYSPEKGSWVELSPQDVLQMLGRAGRPQYDTFGEGIMITTHSEMQYYMSLMNQQLPIESQFVSKLADNLNAEVVLGNIRTRDEGVEWLGYTYLFVRMLRSPGLYSVGADYEDDDALEQKRVDLIHSAAVLLERSGLVRYEKKSGRLSATEFGRIASHYYISHSSMATYNQQIQPGIGSIEMFRIFALSEEFKYIPVRPDEKLELAKLLARVPIPVKESIEEPQAKINVLLQAYISRLKLEGLALMADLVYVTQSAGRVLRAIFEIALKKGWASVAKMSLELCKTAEKRMWPTMTPLRQFPRHSEFGAPTIGQDIIQKAERVDVPWSSYFDLDPPRMGELLGMPKSGRPVVNAVEHFPRLEVQASCQPVTRSLLRVELSITPNFQWHQELHGLAETFWILIEDCDGEEILFHDQFLLRKEYAQSEENVHVVDLTVPITEPMPPNYFITVLSDRWMHSETKIPLSFASLRLPAQFPPHTQLLDLQPVHVAALENKEHQALYKDWTQFNKIQTQAFNALYSTNDSVFIGAPVGSGKTVCAELAFLRHWLNPEAGRAVYIAPFEELVNTRFDHWSKRFASISGGKNIVKLTGETTTDLRLLQEGDLILATPTQWDVISRSWQRRKAIQTVELFIADELHMLGGHDGHIYEIIVSRMHTIGLHTESDLRIIGLSVPLSNGRDVGEWLGARKHNIFNFAPNKRPIPIELHIQSFSIPHFPSMMLAMARPAYQSIVQHASDKPSMVFVSGRKQVRRTALDILGCCIADDAEDRFLYTSIGEIQRVLDRVKEPALAESLTHGIGYHHEALSVFDKQAVRYLFQQGAIQVVIASRDCCWEIDFNAHLVVVMGTQFFDGHEHRYVDYPIAEVLQMFGRSGRSGVDRMSRGVLMVPSVKRDYYRKFLNEALPIESHLPSYLHDAFVSEISTKMIASNQDAVDWTTYTYFYRRLLANPSFYGLVDTSHEGLSTHLSDLVVDTLKELAEADIIELDEEDDSVQPSNPAMIAAYYNVSFVTMQTFLLSLNAKTKMKQLLEIVTSATEFEFIPIRRHEDQILRRVYDRLPVKPQDGPKYESPAFKAHVLLQAHFSRLQLPVDLLEDQRQILKKMPPLLSAAADILSSQGHLNAMAAMEMSQMVVQACWDRDSPLLQMPHFTADTVRTCADFGVKDIFGFMDAMDPEENKDYAKFVERLDLSQKQLADAANFTNEKYPSIEMSFQVLDETITAGENTTLAVTIKRESDDEEEDGDAADQEIDLTVHAPFFPGQKTENWWLVVGNEKTRELCGVKRLTLSKNTVNTKLNFIVQREGKQELTCFLMCDAYVGVDQAPTFEVDVAQGEDDDEEEDEEKDEE